MQLVEETPALRAVWYAMFVVCYAMLLCYVALVWYAIMRNYTILYYPILYYTYTCVRVFGLS